jgi:hypothetical protein
VVGRPVASVALAPVVSSMFERRVGVHANQAVPADLDHPRFDDVAARAFVDDP